MKLGHLVTRANQERQFGASASYHCVLIVTEDGEHKTLMLTDSDMKRFDARAAKNPEDQLQPPEPEENAEDEPTVVPREEPASEVPTEPEVEWKTGFVADAKRWWDSLW